MNKGRMPVCDSPFLLPETAITNVLSHNITEQNIPETGVSVQPFFSGNRCNHSRLIPRIFVPPSTHKKRFPSIEQAKRNLQTAYRYPLQYSIGRLFYNSDKPRKNGRFRKMRSELRESLTSRLGQVILHYTNLANMAVGYIEAKTGKFIAYTLGFLFEKAGLSDSQGRSAISIFKKFGYILIDQKRRKEWDGSYKSDPAVINVSIDFYYDLNISDDQLIQHRKNQGDKLNKEQIQQRKKDFFIQRANNKKQVKAIKRQIVNENPGKERKREHVPLYKDYTGIAKNREEVLKSNEVKPAQGFLPAYLRKIVDDLKKPPP